jgi:hypothetical protein
MVLLHLPRQSFENIGTLAAIFKAFISNPLDSLVNITVQGLQKRLTGISLDI